MSTTATPITRLELRREPIPQGGAAVSLLRNEYEKLGKEFPKYEERHYLAGNPVNSGDCLEYYDGSQWILGQYECNFRVSPPEPTLSLGDGKVLVPTNEHLLRWPENPHERF